MYITFLSPTEDDNVSYEIDHHLISDSIFEFQQCQMETVDPSLNDDDHFEDAIPVACLCTSSSKWGARGSFDASSLLPSDAEQLLRVRKPMAYKTQSVVLQMLAIESLGHEADMVPKLFVQELCIQYRDVRQLQRVLSQT